MEAPGHPAGAGGVSGAIRIVVPGDNAPMSPNRTRRLHWRSLHRLQSAAKTRAGTAWLAAGRPVYAGPFPAVVEVTIRRGRRMDRDNATGSLKAVIDGLFKGRVTPDDSEAFLDLRTPLQEVGAQWKGREEVEFVILPASAR